VSAELTQAPQIRQRICEPLGFLGIAIDVNRNATSQSVISVDMGAVSVRVIRTDEEAMIARSTQRVLIERPLCSRQASG